MSTKKSMLPPQQKKAVVEENNKKKEVDVPEFDYYKDGRWRIMELLLKKIKTTGELADALAKLPRDTVIEPFGDPDCQLWYDEDKKRAYIDNEDEFISDEDLEAIL